MLRLFRKTLAVCLIGFGLRSTTCNITSFFGVAIHYWTNNSNSWDSLAFLLNSYFKNKGECILNDYSCKKGS